MNSAVVLDASRGLSRWRAAWLSLAGAVVVLPGIQWLATADSVWAYPEHTLPTGQLLYLLSKLFALYAIAALAIQVSYGLLGARRGALHLEYGLAFHRALGLVVLVLLLAHALAFIAAASWRTGHFASQFALPDFSHGYYRARIAVGWWAGVGLIVAVLAALARGVLSQAWRRAHWLALPASIAVVVHSLSIGTESRMPAMLIAYGAMGCLILLSVALRVGAHMARRSKG